jgi:AraC-type DNA-binding domain-containing proteins
MPENIKYCHLSVDSEKSFFYDHVHIVWNEQIKLHQSPAWELSYVIKGSGTRIVGDTMETFMNGEVVFLPPGMPHGWYFDQYDHDEEGKIENITIVFSDSLLANSIAVFPETKPFISRIEEYKHAIRFEGDTLCRLQMIMTDMLLQNDMERVASLIQLLSVIASSHETRVVGLFNKRQNKSAVKIQEVWRYIVHNYQRKISLDEVAQYVGMNRSSFCIFFKREKGKSFFTALNEYRIDCSCLMLRETTKPIADICFSVGFEDVPYYNRTFKKMKGETPKNYRAKNQLMQSGK